MYLDSNVLVPQLLSGADSREPYNIEAFQSGGVILAPVLVEVLAVVERHTRRGLKLNTGHFGDSEAKKYRRELADTVLGWASSGSNITFAGEYTVTALELMRDIGLDFVDCLLIQCAYSGAGKVATNDKDMRAALGSFLWEPTT